jgi:hypothetical protein
VFRVRIMGTFSEREGRIVMSGAFPRLYTYMNIIS